MKRKMRWLCSWLCAVTVSAGVFSEPVLAGSLNSDRISETAETDLTMPASGENGVTVTTQDGFKKALANGNSPIIVDNLISIDDGAETDGRMRPVKIPGNTVITGTEKGVIVCRSPIQIDGDGVCFRNIKLQFDSSNALGSVPHREIFLAGHSLTMDNVNTYQEGSNGEFGPIAGTEKELLPTVYAGGYPGTQIGSNASLTVQNSNDQTMFQGIYMSHADIDNNVPYRGTAVLNMDSKALVRENVYTDQNSLAQIQITGSGGARTKRFYGNENTTLTIKQSAMRNYDGDAVIIGDVKHLILDEGAELSPRDGLFCDVTLRNDACLDLNELKNAEITGNFNGGENQEGRRGILVLKPEGVLTVGGKVSGTTQFQTGHRNFPGTLIPDWKYIIADRSSESALNFILPDKKLQEQYTLDYSDRAWTARYHGEVYEEPQIGSVDILSAPSAVDVNKIMAGFDDTVLEPSAVCRIVWKDLEGNPFDAETIEYWGFDYYVVVIKTEYWNSEAPEILAKTEWSNAIYLAASQEEQDTYYLQAGEGVRTGDYTMLFCSEYPENLDTVADVKALENTVKAAMNIRLYQGETEEKPVIPNPPAEEEKPVIPNPPAEEKPAVPSNPPHVHYYTSTITRGATCTGKGIRTFRCSRCTSSYTTEIPMKAHTYKDVLTKAVPGRDGSIVRKCSVCQAVSRKTVIYRPETMKLSTSTYTYSGGLKKPGVSIKDSKGKVISSSQYTVTYQNNKNVGKASVTVRFKDRYSGTMKKTFTICPKVSSISKLTAKSKAVAVKWKKQSTQTDGYEIQCSTSKKFSKKTTKTETVKSRKTTSKTIKKLKAKKKYYVRIRTYKKVKVNGKYQKFYSAWSKTKTVTTKK